MPLKRRDRGDPTYPLRERGAGGEEGDLHLVHVTSVGWAREILNSGKIETSYCSVFKNELSYFFALRPAYKPKEANETHRIVDFFPVAFVLDPHSFAPPAHVYPFDTGGASSGSFDLAIDPFIFLDDYALEPSISGANQHIFWAFDGYSEYYDGLLKADLRTKIPDWDTHALSFWNIAKLSSLGSNRPDGRASAVEVAYFENIDLIDCLKFSVFPDKFLFDEIGDNFAMLNRTRAICDNFETYNWRPSTKPIDYHNAINRIVREYFRSIGLFE